MYETDVIVHITSLNISGVLGGVMFLSPFSHCALASSYRLFTMSLLFIFPRVKSCRRQSVHFSAIRMALSLWISTPRNLLLEEAKIVRIADRAILSLTRVAPSGTLMIVSIRLEELVVPATPAPLEVL